MRVLCPTLVLTCLSTHIAFAGTPQSSVVTGVQKVVRTDHVTLAELLAHADVHAPRLEVAQGGRLRAHAQVEAAGRLQPYNPSISFGLGRRSQGNQTGLDAEVEIQQQLRVAGQRRREQAAAKQLDASGMADVKVVRWAIHTEIHRTFQLAVTARERARLAEELAEFTREMESLVSRRVEVGEESPMVLELARAERVLAEANSLDRQARVQAIDSELAEAAGWPGDRSLTVVGSLPVARRLVAMEALVEAAFRANPTLASFRAQREWASAESYAQTRRAIPSPTFGVRYAREGGVAAQGGSAVDTDVWMGTVSLPIPMFARNQGARLRANADHELSRIRERVAAKRFDRQVRRAAALVEASARRVVSFEIGVLGAYARNLSALLRAYEVGELDLFQLTQARQRMWQGRLSALDALEDHVGAVADLEGLVGAEIGEFLFATKSVRGESL